MEACQKAEFREAIASTVNAKYIEDQQMHQWHFYIRKRQRLQVIFAIFYNLKILKQFSQLMQQISTSENTNTEIDKTTANTQNLNLSPPKL